ncbi:Phospholipase D alpha 4 [Vitis vinifera]|uniref:phospholipase D n=1 Tax=Vitis vinifera TaxID=29760 RepID=A0A438EVZ8_VITVI|nr:Phospholipase D alpha 4 [Vitis vinifera]
MQCMFLNGKACYVTIKIDDKKVAKTSHESDRVWNQTFQILCAHLIDSTITITLKTKCSILGRIQIQAHQIVHEASFIDGPAEFEPTWGNILWNGDFQGVKNATFPQRSDCSVILYQDAHHCSTFQPPYSLCKAPRKLWEDVYKAIDDAKYLIYIAGWSFNPKMVLVRDPQTDIPYGHGVKLGELLKRKAEEGVAVRIMVWDDETSLPLIKNEGVMSNTMKRPLPTSNIQKCRSSISPSHREIMSFVGGLDLCNGRYDTEEHSLFRTLNTESHSQDFYQTSLIGACLQKGGPREPWHDAHACITGEAARDVLTNFEQRWTSHLPRNFAVEQSIHEAYVEAIRRAERFIYIENQYFIGGCHLWEKDQHAGCRNLIPIEIALKVASKIRAKERFAVYILIPMWPEGAPESEPGQDILHWTRETMAMMYRLIGEAIDENGGSGHPRDYLNFFCLANREEKGKGEYASPHPPHPATQYWNAQKHRRFMVYVHSKLMIVDDTYILIGSANVNQRSMDGQRDTEIAVGCYQSKNVEVVFQEPQSLECVERLRFIGEKMWGIYSAEEVEDMEGVHLVTYPVTVTKDGSVEDLAEGGNFPDTNTPIRGRRSRVLPPIFTT